MAFSVCKINSVYETFNGAFGLLLYKVYRVIRDKFYLS